MNSVANSPRTRQQAARDRKTTNTSYSLRSRAEIEGLLKKLNRNHTLLSIRLENSKKTFGSMLLEINPEKNYLVLDELYPRHEIKGPLLNSKLRIDTQLEGVELGFSVKISAVAERDGTEYYRVNFPASVFHHQRRDCFRVGVGVTSSIPVALSTQDDVLLHAELRDISLGGINIRINTPVAESIAVGDEIPTCIIHTLEGKKIVAAMEIARIEENTQTRSLRVGARFIQLPAADRQELSRFIAKLQRENIQKMKRIGDMN